MSLRKSKPKQEMMTYSIQHSEQVRSFILNRQEGTFGIEYYLDDHDKKMTFFVNNILRTNLTPTRPIPLKSNYSNISCYYLRFQKPNYAPFSFTKGEDVWELIQKYTQSHLKEGNKIFIQIIFQIRSNEAWKVESYEKYNGYLNGINNVSINRNIQYIQYKVARIFKLQKPGPIDEVIEKLEQVGYSTCIKLVIESEGAIREKLLNRIMLTFNTQRYVNGWEYKQVLHKHKFISDFQLRRFAKQYKSQILCPSELNIYFGGEEVEKGKRNQTARE